MTQDNYQPNRRKPLATLAHYNLDNEEGASDASLKVLVVDRRGDFTQPSSGQPGGSSRRRTWWVFRSPRA